MRQRFFALVTIFVIGLIATPIRVWALSAQDRHSLNTDSIYYFAGSPGGSAGCVVSTTQLSTDELQKINQNQATYQQAAQQTNVPWQLLAAIHYRETDLSTTESNLFQITGYNGPNDFLSQAIAAGNFLQQSSVPDNYPNHRQPLKLTGNDPEEIKDTLYSYNGRADAYATQAQKLGFNPAAQAYEGSPYIMNDFDSVHTNMGIITGAHGPDTIDGIDTRLGAFTVYSILIGASGTCQSGSVPNGNVQQLAQQIITNPNITFDYGANGYVAQPFKDLAAGNLATSSTGCPPTTVSLHILQEILLIAETHTLQISALTTDHTCGDVHAVGRAVDIDYLDGQRLGTGTGPNEPSLYNTPLSNTLMTTALPALPPGSGFGDCDGHTVPTNGLQIIFFADNCNHIHTQVPPGQ